MLKFLQSKSSNRLTTKPLVKYQPQLIYGHTVESPNHFLNRHTIYFNSKQQFKSTKPLPGHQLLNQKEKVQKPIENGLLQTSEQFNISSQNRKIQNGERSKKTKKQVNDETKQQFNITRGEFSNFLDKHKHYGSLGTIHKQNQNKSSTTQAQPAHKYFWNKSNNTVSKCSPTNSIMQSESLPSYAIGAYKNFLNHSKNSTLTVTRSNSVSIFQTIKKKSELKLRRDQFIGLMRKESKEKFEKKYQHFGLPRLGVEHQLILLEKNKFIKNQQKGEFQELKSDLNKFQQSLYYKFK